MGCCSSGQGAAPPPKKAANAQAKAAAAKAAAEKRKNLKKEDYIISKKTGEVIVREQPTINGQQFNIEECTGCDIFLLDHINTSFIDYCEDCRIFVGPVETSIFVRNCKNCSFIIACQQFRCVDCKDCRLSLFCMTEPIIETSTNMKFACFDFGYFSLGNQLAQARLKTWNNKWWMVHDFNKNSEKPNWGLLPQEEVPQLLRLEACNSQIANKITEDELATCRVVPMTLGSRPRPSEETSLVLFLPDSDAVIESFLGLIAKVETCTLCRTRSTVATGERATTLFAWAKDQRKLAAQCKGKEVAGVEVCGEGVQDEVGKIVANMDGSSAKCVRVVPAQEVPNLAVQFFDAWKDEV